MKDTVEFVGIPTGDGTSFCWEVDKETWMRFNDGKEPKDYDFRNPKYNKKWEIISHDDTLNLYPDDIFLKDFPYLPDKLKIKIEYEDVK